VSEVIKGALFFENLHCWTCAPLEEPQTDHPPRNSNQLARYILATRPVIGFDPRTFTQWPRNGILEITFKQTAISKQNKLEKRRVYLLSFLICIFSVHIFFAYIFCQLVIVLFFGYIFGHIFFRGKNLNSKIDNQI